MAAADVADDYTVVTLTPPTAPGTELRQPFPRGGIAETGYVFHWFTTSDFTTNTQEWTVVTGTPDDPVLTDIPGPPNTPFPRPNADGTTLISYSESGDGSGPFHMVTIEADGTVTEVSPSAAGAVGIDDDGTMVYVTATCGDVSCAQIVKQPPTGPPTVLLSGPEAATVTPVGIRNGWVAGIYTLDFVSGHAVRWNPAGELETVESPDGALTAPVDVNSTGQMGGQLFVFTESGFTATPVRWEVDGSMTELDTLGYPNGDVSGIADDGTVVGVVYSNSPSGDALPVAWRPDGTAVDLSSDLPSPSSDLNLMDVNAAGQVLFTYLDHATFSPMTAVLDPVVTLESVDVTPASATVPFGGSAALAASATYSDSSTEDVTAVAEWSSSNESVATVSSSGLVTAVGIGTATISATVDGVTGTSAITVVPATTTLSASGVRTGGLTARITYTGTLTGAPTGQTVSFASGSSAACSAVTNASGVATCSVDYGVVATLLGVLFPGTAFTPPAVGAPFTATYAGTPSYSGSSTGGTIS